MEDRLITTKEVGNYRIKIYYDTDSICPCESWDNEKLIEVFKKGIMVKLKYVEKRVLDTFTDNGVDLSNYTHCIIVKRNFYLAW